MDYDATATAHHVMIMGQVLKCRECGNWYTVTDNEGCPHCEQPTEKPYRLSENDRKFLRAIRIKPEA